MPQYTGTLQLNESTPAEQTLKEITITKAMEIKSIWVMGMNTTVMLSARIYKKDIGGTYREIFSTFGEGPSIQASTCFDLLAHDTQVANYSYFGKNILSLTDIKITLESAGGGSGAVEVEYEIEYDDKLDDFYAMQNSTAQALMSFGFGDKVFVDFVHGTDSTALPYGTNRFPTNTLVNAKTIATAQYLHKALVNLGSAARTQASVDLDGLHIIGTESPYGSGLIDFQYQQSNCVFENLQIKNTVEHLENCKFLGCRVPAKLQHKNVLFDRCIFTYQADLHPRQNYTEVFKDTFFETGSVIDFTDATAGGTIDISNCKGHITITNLTVASTIYIHSGGGLKLTIAASCTAGTIVIYGNLDNLVNSGTATVTPYKAIYQTTKTAIEDILELMYARLAGYNQLANTGASDSHLEVKLYNYLEDTLRKTLNILKPAGTNNTQVIDTNAMAGQKES